MENSFRDIAIHYSAVLEMVLSRNKRLLTEVIKELNDKGITLENQFSLEYVCDDRYGRRRLKELDMEMRKIAQTDK